MNSRRFPFASALALLAICLFAFWVRLPFISSGLPYLYDEDEGHHHNRVVDMVKNGQWNPKYFRKPSLHFYLRMPVVAAAFLVGVRKGQLRRLDEIQTYDSFGLGKFAYTTSHPGIVKANRSFSALLGIATIILVYSATFLFTRSPGISLGAAFLPAVSPDFVFYSTVVGVDIVMAFMVLAAVFATAALTQFFTLRRLVLAGLLCGLAVSSKYNALPIVLVPIVAVFVCNRVEPVSLLFALLSPAVGFLIGSPFILSELPLFLNQFAYEIWHYGIAGHAEHTADPGLPQIVHYISWFARDAVGLLALIFGLGGLVLCLLTNRRLGLVTAVFPILYFMLMIAQRANFTRNMVVLVPFLAIFSGITIHFILNRYRKPSEALLFGAMLTLSLQPAFTLLAHSGDVKDIVESRNDLSAWLSDVQGDPITQRSTAVAGQLLLPRPTLRLPGVANIDGKSLDPLTLYQQGFERIITGTYEDIALPEAPAWNLVKEFAGTDQKQRVVRNPHISVFEFDSSKVDQLDLLEIASREHYELYLRMTQDRKLTCETKLAGKIIPEDLEGHCWLTGKVTPVSMHSFNPLAANGPFAHLAFEASSPWEDQVLSIEQSGATYAFPVPVDHPWKEISFPIPERFQEEGIRFSIALSRIESPREMGISEDSRRLGVALRNFRFLK